MSSSQIISRSLEIPASKSKIFEIVSDFKYFNEYQPWVMADPHTKFSISSPSHGVGASYEWSSTLIGGGKMSIEQISPNKEVIKMSVDFHNPNSKGNIVYWRIEELEEKDACIVSWQMQPKVPVFLFFMKNVMNKMMDAMIGPAYEHGLLRLAQFIQPGYSSLQIESPTYEELDAIHYIGIPFKRTEVKEIGELCQIAFPRLNQCLDYLDLSPTFAFISYGKYKALNQSIDGSINFAVEDSLDNYASAISKFNSEHPLEHNEHSKFLSDIVFGTSPKQHMSKVIYRDKNYDTIMFAWDVAFMSAHKLQSNATKKLPHLDVYRKMPHENNGIGVTELYVPIDKDKLNNN